MKTTIRHTVSLTVACLLWAGCDAPLFHVNWDRQPTEPVSAVVANETQPEAEQGQELVARFPGDPEPIGPEPSDPELASLDERIQKFVEQLGPEGKDRDAASRAVPREQPEAAGLPRNRNHSDTADSVREEQAALVPGISKPRIPMTPDTDAQTVATGANTAVSVGSVGSPQPPRPQAGPLSPTAQEPRIELIDIRPMTSTGSLPEGDNPPSANQAVNAPEPADPPQNDLVSLIRSLQQTIADHPQELADHFRLRLLYMATGQSEQVTEPPAEVDPVQGRMLSAACRTMTTVYDTMREPDGQGAAEALAAVEDLHRLLSERSPVIIPRIVLVTAVNSFGDYRPVSPARFEPGTPIHVYCYTEVANFRSEPTSDGRIRTSLAARLEVFDATGASVWQQSVGQIEDRTLTPRRDFFVPLEMRLPPNLPEGDYALKVTIEDKLGATTDQQRLTFAVGR